MAAEVAFVKTFLAKLGTKPVVFKPDFEPPADEPAAHLPTPSRPFELKYAQTATSADRDDGEMDEVEDAPFSVKVKLMKGNKTVTVNTSAGDTVERLKALIAEASGVSSETQRLVFSGKALQDDRTVGSYNLGPDSTLHLMVKAAAAPSAAKAQGTEPTEEQTGPRGSPPEAVPAGPSVEERLLELLGKADLWAAIKAVLAANGVDENLLAIVVERFRGSLANGKSNE